MKKLKTQKTKKDKKIKRQKEKPYHWVALRCCSGIRQTWRERATHVKDIREYKQQTTRYGRERLIIDEQKGRAHPHKLSFPSHLVPCFLPRNSDDDPCEELSGASFRNNCVYILSRHLAIAWLPASGREQNAYKRSLCTRYVQLESFSTNHVAVLRMDLRASNFVASHLDMDIYIYIHTLL